MKRFEVPQWGGFPARDLIRTDALQIANLHCSAAAAGFRVPEIIKIRVAASTADLWDDFLWTITDADEAQPSEKQWAADLQRAIIGNSVVLLSEGFLAATGCPNNLGAPQEWIGPAKWEFLTDWDFVASSVGDHTGFRYVGVRFFTPIPYADGLGHHFDYASLHAGRPLPTWSRGAADDPTELVGSANSPSPLAAAKPLAIGGGRPLKSGKPPPGYWTAAWVEGQKLFDEKADEHLFSLKSEIEKGSMAAARLLRECVREAKQRQLKAPLRYDGPDISTCLRKLDGHPVMAELRRDRDLE